MLLLALVPLSVTYSLCLVDSLYVCHLVATVSTCCSSCHHYRCWLGRSFISCELTWLKVASMCLTLQGKAPPPKPESSFSLTKLQAQRDEVERADARSASAALAAPSRGSKDVFAKDQHAIVWLEIAISGKVTVACLSCARYASTGCLPHRSSSSGNNGHWDSHSTSRNERGLNVGRSNRDRRQQLWEGKQGRACACVPCRCRWQAGNQAAPL